MSKDSMPTDSISNDDIKNFIQLVQSTGIAELEVQRGEHRVRIRGQAAATETPVIYAAPPTQTASTTAAPVAAPAATPAPAEPAASDTILVKSPIVGTFYESPSPGAAAFVKVGDHVEPGQVLCIIESMKLMNEIESEVAGTIVSRLTESGRPVEYGEALFAIRPR